MRRGSIESLNEFKIAETHTFQKKIESYEFKGYYNKIKTIIYPILRQNPYHGPNIKRLKGKLKPVYRYRIGNYRLFYTINKEKMLVFILDFIHRKEAYR